MEEREWRELVHRAAGVPHAVVQKDEIAVELIVRGIEIDSPAIGAALQTHSAAASVVIADLPPILAAGELDRVVAGLVPLDLNGLAEILADRVSPDLPTASARRARKSVLKFLLPTLLDLVRDYKPPNVALFSSHEPALLMKGPGSPRCETG